MTTSNDTLVSMDTDITPAAPKAETNKLKFTDFPISEQTLESLKAMGLESPTPIQEKALPILLDQKSDFIGLASTGTGKTAAFGIPLVEKTEAANKFVQALILSPTRELAVQVAEQLKNIGRFKKISVATVYGGNSYRTQVQALRNGAQLVVATPGRLVDLLEQGYIDLKKLHTLVLDEADEMMSMGFQEELELILKATHPPKEKAVEGEAKSANANRAACTTWLFSATMSSSVRSVANKFLSAPQTVAINKSETLATNIKQMYYPISNDMKTEVIMRILELENDFYGIIFCQTKMECVEIEEKLTRRGFAVASLHGDKQQREREVTLKKFRAKEVKVLVATDVAARGLDVKDLTHVINHSLPWDVESYTHRIGRTGRNGQKGTAIALVARDQVRLFHRIQTVTKATIDKGVIPTAKNVAYSKVQNILSKMGAVSVDDKAYRLAVELVGQVSKNTPSEYLQDEQLDLWARFLTSHYSQILVDNDNIREFTLDTRGGGGAGRPWEERGRGDRGGFRGNDRGGGYRNDRGGSGGGGYRRDDRGPRVDSGYTPGGSSAPAYAASAPKSYDDAPKRSFEDRPQKSFDKPARSFEDRPARSFDKPRSFEDRPQRSFEDRPQRSFDKPARTYEDRPVRSFGSSDSRPSDRPARSFETNPARAFDKPARSFDRPPRSFEDAPKKTFGTRDDSGFVGRTPPRPPIKKREFDSRDSAPSFREKIKATRTESPYKKDMKSSRSESNFNR